MDNVVYNDAPHIYEAEGSGILIKLEGTYIVELKYHFLFDASDEVHINALLSLNGKRNVLPSYKNVNYSTVMQKTGVMTFIVVLTEQDRIVYQFMGQKSYVFFICYT